LLPVADYCSDIPGLHINKFFYLKVRHFSSAT
jgi:hypothetical protein